MSYRSYLRTSKSIPLKKNATHTVSIKFDPCKCNHEYVFFIYNYREQASCQEGVIYGMHAHTHNTSLFASSCQHNDSNHDERQQYEGSQEVAQMLQEEGPMLGEDHVHHPWTLHLLRPWRKKQETGQK